MHVQSPQPLKGNSHLEVPWAEAYLHTKWHLDASITQKSAEKWGGGCAPFGEGELGPHLTQCVWAKTYLHAKFHLDPSNQLATVHQRYRQTVQTTDR